MKKIIHPTDFSEPASVALKYAYRIALKTGAELIVAHISDVPTIMNSRALSSFEEMEADKKDTLLKKLEYYCVNTLRDFPERKIFRKEVVFSSSVQQGILELLERENADLVVLGTKGQSRLQEVVMGSTAKKMIARSNCPVLAVPENSIPGDLKHFVYASDFDRNDIDVLKKLAAFATELGTDLTVLHIFPSDADNTDDIEAFKTSLAEQIRDTEVNYAFRVASVAGTAIAQYLRESGAGLLVMFEKGHDSLPGKLFHHDLVKEFAAHTTVPLLSYNAHALKPVEI